MIAVFDVDALERLKNEMGWCVVVCISSALFLFPLKTFFKVRQERLEKTRGLWNGKCIWGGVGGI